MPLILPNSSGSNGLLIGGTSKPDGVWECPIPGCEATYGKGQSRAIARHIDTQHEDDIAEMAAKREAEPLRQIDEEQVRFLREQAQEKRDKTVPGVN